MTCKLINKKWTTRRWFSYYTARQARQFCRKPFFFFSKRAVGNSNHEMQMLVWSSCMYVSLGIQDGPRSTYANCLEKEEEEEKKTVSNLRATGMIHDVIVQHFSGREY